MERVADRGREVHAPEELEGPGPALRLTHPVHDEEAGRGRGHPSQQQFAGDAWNLAAGLALYLIGEAWMGWILGVRRAWVTALVGVAMLLSVPIGTEVNGLAQLLVVSSAMVAFVVADQVTRRRR